MKSYQKFLKSIEKKKTYLCIGLDSDIDKIPNFLKSNKDPIFEFNKAIINSTSDLTACYKINFAFYEQLGINGIESLNKTIEIIPKDIPVIADVKRGDIGNTSKKYAQACYDYFKVDAVTVNPYMGYDSVSPFLEYNDKFVFLLALTSNKGSEDFQRIKSNEKPIFEYVIEKSKTWADYETLGYVIGATHPDELSEIRKKNKEFILLIPGVGTQGGDIKSILVANDNNPAIINVSRDIIFSSKDEYFAEKTREKAIFYKNALVSIL